MMILINKTNILNTLTYSPSNRHKSNGWWEYVMEYTLETDTPYSPVSYGHIIDIYDTPKSKPRRIELVYPFKYDDMTFVIEEQLGMKRKYYTETIENGYKYHYNSDDEQNKY